MHNPLSKLQKVSIAGAAAVLSGCILLGTTGTSLAQGIANNAGSPVKTTTSATHRSDDPDAANGHRSAQNPAPHPKPMIQTIGFAAAIVILVIGERDRLFRRRQPAKNSGG